MNSPFSPLPAMPRAGADRSRSRAPESDMAATTVPKKFAPGNAARLGAGAFREILLAYALHVRAARQRARHGSLRGTRPPPNSAPCTVSCGEALFGRRDLVVTYDRGGGLSFAEPRMQADFRNALSGYDSFTAPNYSHGLPRNPDGVLNLLDNYLRLRIADGQEDRADHRFRRDHRARGRRLRHGRRRPQRAGHPRSAGRSIPSFLSADITICLIAENLTELNAGLVQNPGVAAIAIPLPDEERAAGIHPRQLRRPLPAEDRT